MAFLLRSLCAVIGAAFLFAVANLFISGLPEGEDPAVQLASGTPAAAPNAPTTTAVLRDVAFGLLGISTEPTAALQSAPGSTAPNSTAPNSSAPNSTALDAGTTQGAFTQTSFVQAAPSALASDLEAEWRSWMAANDVTEGAMVVLMPDGAMHRAGLDRATDASAPVASLSKAITGMCMDIVLQEQGLGWYTSLGDIAPQMSALRVTPQPWNQDITLAALVNHTSGLAPDLTQGTMGSDLHGALGLHRRTASEALREENMQGTPREYFYNNTNYAVLGVAIEALTGQSYGDACMERVVTPAGVTDAVIHGAMGSRSSFGGWEMSAESYARLAQFWFTQGNEVVDRPYDRPMHDNYSLGYVIHGSGADAQVSHAGRFCHTDSPNTGAYFHARGDGVVFSANWTGPCVAATDTGLDRAIADLMR